ncbi:RNA polymerase sigma-70 factor, ECF subfamily [Zhouia amylolytica]|uniref:RNA polymerase sigma-70 factor, ECF subfamily n=1 Tax=Zhouia amylolytica TaxID=376730 RepID=A0A1I6RJX6_9FLAO|nr:RNA polymerase sigma-70 factor, ECF subfamily [Zhouia amylolytica]
MIKPKTEHIKITAGSYKEIFYSFYPRLLSFCEKYVKDTYAAEEIVEECMLYLWERKSDMNKIDDLKSYLYTMVKHKSYAYLKQTQKVVSLDAYKDDALSQEDAYIIEEEVHAILISALEKLPERCRKVFELSCLEGLKYKDIAEDMDISVNTVKSQRARAIELLKIQLKDHPILLGYLAFLLKNQIF